MASPEDPYKKVCKYSQCSKSYTAKRQNQQYCCSECKVKANNSLASKQRLTIKRIDSVLKLNRKILEEFYVGGMTVVDLEVLLTKGFDLSKHTGRRQDANGNFSIPEIYNYTIEKINQKQFKIHKLW